MNQFKSLLLFILFLLAAVSVSAQNRDTKLTIQVTSVKGDNLGGQLVVLKQTDYQVSYGTLKLNAEGMCELKVYAGNHLLEISRDGFNPISYDFVVEETETEKTVEISLTEKTRTPFALKADVAHNVFDGSNAVMLSWNIEAPAFFDDFESYDPFSIRFGEWTGIDADNEVAAALIGSYPNRGVMQYAQIINPLAVEPTWWYDYPILRPYSGQQYVGFTRTSSGNANDDWLISPVITVGTDNILSFMGKAADQFTERFKVFVTTQVDNPVQSDFIRLDQDNYETADYRGWKQYSYDLSAYAGKQIKFAIRYISDYNRYRSFMLMIDDVYVGQPDAGVNGLYSRGYANGARRVASRRSLANPNEYFRIFVDGEEVTVTDEYSCLLSQVSAGQHTLGVQAHYIQAVSEMTTMQLEIPDDSYAHVVFNVSANSKLGVDGQKLSLTSLSSAEVYEAVVNEGKVEFLSLPFGHYVVNIDEGAFEQYQQSIIIEADATVQVELSDRILTPYNITATADENGIYTLRWNQDLLFCDSFEDYPDFATGTFGEWKSVDVDKMPVYPVALGSAANIVSFPGSGTGNNPVPIAPMVFNPWNTVPAMLPTDVAIAAPTGDKTVIFFSSQLAKSDKWLISPLIDIHDDYQLAVKAKAYTALYRESMEFCLSEGGDQPADFTPISIVESVGAEQWTLYETDLSPFVGRGVRLAIHYTSNDAFLTQIDDFTVGPKDGQGEIVDYGNVVRFEISVDGEHVGQSEHAEFVLPALTDGQHTIGIKAVYQNGESQEATYVITVSTGIAAMTVRQLSSMMVYDLSGMYMGNRLNNLPAGIYFVRQNGKIIKVRK